ncbi:hypothetical protein OCF84_21010 (plasmid) [Shewanella xiamenensis]|uniref:Uncharacterized protein n=1 Tax=Shewanella xiamenensis TaxID=332186 RepID=A0ABT6UDW8_9GAMM|nr:hypothetical protein [Shewanella xiamenensis]MDI5832642.1 hypothetical protein [Shewanella xiamenensis]WHF58000.1 hypothetical protein OCF84_21010 [Shewanella xiamenensis]
MSHSTSAALISITLHDFRNSQFGNEHAAMRYSISDRSIILAQMLNESLSDTGKIITVDHPLGYPLHFFQLDNQSVIHWELGITSAEEAIKSSIQPISNEEPTEFYGRGLVTYFNDKRPYRYGIEADRILRETLRIDHQLNLQVFTNLMSMIEQRATIAGANFKGIGQQTIFEGIQTGELKCILDVQEDPLASNEGSLVVNFTVSKVSSPGYVRFRYYADTDSPRCTVIVDETTQEVTFPYAERLNSSFGHMVNSRIPLHGIPSDLTNNYNRRYFSHVIGKLMHEGVYPSPKVVAQHSNMEVGLCKSWMTHRSTDEQLKYACSYHVELIHDLTALKSSQSLAMTVLNDIDQFKDLDHLRCVEAFEEQGLNLIKLMDDFKAFIIRRGDSAFDNLYAELSNSMLIQTCLSLQLTQSLGNNMDSSPLLVADENVIQDYTMSL